MNTEIKKQTRSRKHRHWQAHVTQQEQSGISRAEYSRQHKLSYHALTYWCKKLSAPKERNMSLVPVTIRHDMQRVAPNHSEPLKILLPGVVTVEVGDNFNPLTLNKILDIMEARQCCR